MNLQGRGTETEESLAKRLATAEKELAGEGRSRFDLVLMNDDLGCTLTVNFALCSTYSRVANDSNRDRILKIDCW